MEARDGGRHALTWQPRSSALLHEDGTPVIAAGASETAWPQAEAISPQAPGRKSARLRKLKIQLGLGCNMACTYCMQAGEADRAARTATRDAEGFLAQLDTWLEGAPERIELWGGEPLLYWHKIAVLVPALRRRFPRARFLMITNGSLLTAEIVDRLDAWDIAVAISHDGPGQALRGLDPLEDPERRGHIEDLVARLAPRGQFSFNAVLTPRSFDIAHVLDWFEARLGPQVPVGFEGVVHDYGSGVRFDAAGLRALTEATAYAIANGTGLRSASIRRKVEAILAAISQRRPARALGQKCGMDREDAIAVDLAGNVLTCQNVGAESRHRIGHVSDMGAVALDTAWHWSHRPDCPRCAVLPLCQGGCMYQGGAEFATSCAAEQAFNLGVLAGALYHVTGWMLVDVEEMR